MHYPHICDLVTGSMNAIENKRSAPHYRLEKDCTFYTSVYLAIQLGAANNFFPILNSHLNCHLRESMSKDGADRHKKQAV